MKKIDSIPTNKIQRVSKLLTTGAKIGGNYLKYYADTLVNDENAKENLHQNNAEDIYDSLKELKGSALKVAQMLSMEKNLLPIQYVEKFSLSQFSVPPLSAPLVRKTFKTYFERYPEEIFDTFTPDSVNAASIGQVHRATKGDKNLAVKIQYPGVRDSIKSDVAIVKPIAIRMFNLQGISDEYFQEVEDKLTEETDYILELQRSNDMREACKSITSLKFPTYYPEFSCAKIITMDWMEGKHLTEFLETNPSQEIRDNLGQTLWNFYMFQIHHLKRFHADPHPGNFLVDKENQLVAIDFGCIKEIPMDFYVPYFEVSAPETLANLPLFQKKLTELEILKSTDTPKETQFFTDLFHQLLTVFTKPIHTDTFDFSDLDFYNQVADLSQQFAQDKTLRKMNGNRGSRHFIYVNRTFFGLYQLMFDIKAKIEVNQYQKFVN
ncbi:MAG: AarF/UbiB family protein [Chitinophagales bacterium]|jgi:predicted unusual protein kinase regulating ubiquinone biosynthesis (AarF/ABC1/UbiB family)|nr:AarF/UbiB family protein [Chitinophagales bacterium]